MEPGILDLGTVHPGGTKPGFLFLRNGGDQPVSLDTVTTSCPCLAVVSAPRVILAGRAAPLDLVYRCAENENFRGELAVRVQGMQADHRPAFSVTVRIRVESNPSVIPVKST